MLREGATTGGTELAARLVTNVPVRQLDCRADESAVRALEEALRRT